MRAGAPQLRHADPDTGKFHFESIAVEVISILHCFLSRVARGCAASRDVCTHPLSVDDSTTMRAFVRFSSNFAKLSRSVRPRRSMSCPTSVRSTPTTVAPRRRRSSAPPRATAKSASSPTASLTGCRRRGSESGALLETYGRPLKPSALLTHGDVPPDSPVALARLPPSKAGSHPSCTDPLPDISILESYPTREFGFDIGHSA